jgi:hypothetical protein
MVFLNQKDISELKRAQALNNWDCVLSCCASTTADVTRIKCCIMAYLRAAAGGSKAEGLAQSCPSCREALAGLGSQSCGLVQPSALLASGSSLIPAEQQSRHASCSNKHSLTSICTRWKKAHARHTQLGRQQSSLRGILIRSLSDQTHLHQAQLQHDIPVTGLCSRLRLCFLFGCRLHTC